MTAQQAIDIINGLISEREALQHCAEILRMVGTQEQVVEALHHEAEKLDHTLVEKRQELADLDEQVRAKQERVAERLALIEQDARERRKVILDDLTTKQAALDNWHVTAKNEEVAKEAALAAIQARIDEARQELQAVQAQVSRVKQERAALAAALGV